jgi:tetratricopeptide (TPR) repeat protein
MIEDKLGKTSDAMEHYQKALSLSPQDEDVLKNLGLINIKLGKANLAQIYLQRAININPNNDEVILALGQSYDALDNYQNALDCYLKLENKSFDEIDIHYYIAMVYGKLNNQGESHYYFGLYFKKAKKKESALFHFREALNFFPAGSERTEIIKKAISDLNSPEKSKSQNKTTSKNYN